MTAQERASETQRGRETKQNTLTLSENRRDHVHHYTVALHFSCGVHGNMHALNKCQVQRQVVILVLQRR